jgi:hypothetical protein
MLSVEQANELIRMKAAIDAAEMKQAQLQGKLDGLFERLKKDFGFSSLEETDKALVKLDNTLIKKEDSLANNVDDLAEKFKKAQEANNG